MTPGQPAQTPTNDMWENAEVDTAVPTGTVDSLDPHEMESPASGLPRFDRRDLFRNVAAVAGLLGAGAVVAACDMVQNTTDPQLHLLRRTTYGLDVSSINSNKNIFRSA